MNIAMPATGPRRNSNLRFIAPLRRWFVTMPPLLFVRRLARRSFSGGGSVSGSARGRRQPLALELPDVRDDRPPVRGRNRPAISRHQPFAVRDDVEDLSVRVLHDLFLVKVRRRDVASLKQDAFAVPPSVVTRLAVD